MANGKTILITLTAAILFGGKLRKPGETITCSEDEAKNLLHRGRGKLAESDGDEKPLSEHTVDELKEIASDLEIEGHANLKKGELIEAIEAAEAE